MQATLYNTTSPNNQLDKVLTNAYTVPITLKDTTNIYNISLVIAGDIALYNYMYIADFGRYYFITDITSIKNGLYMVEARVDVLSTFKNEIRANTAVISLSQNENKMITDNRYVMQADHDYDYIPFSKGLTNDINYILVGSGGITS